MIEIKSQEEEILDNLIISLIKNFNFKEKNIKVNKISENFKWRPHINAKKSGENWLIIIRTVPNIPDFFWGLFSESIKYNPKIRIFLAVPSKNKRYFERNCRRYGIGILEVDKRQVKFFYQPIYKKYKKKIRTKSRIYHCYLSSKQYIEERDIADNIISGFSNLIQPNAIMAFRMENYGHRNPKKNWEVMKEKIDFCDFFLCIIHPEKYSKWVDKEVRYVFRKKRNDKISVLVKRISSDDYNKKVRPLLDFLKKKIKYVEYSEDKFQNNLHGDMMRLIQPIVKRINR